MEPKIKYQGYLIFSDPKARFEVIAARIDAANSPFGEYFSELAGKYREIAENDIKKRNIVNIEYTYLINRLKKIAYGQKLPKTQVNDLGEGFFELKIKQTKLRVPFYYDEINRRVIILTHHFVKKGDKTPKSELLRMKEIKRQFDLFRSMGEISE